MRGKSPTLSGDPNAVNVTYHVRRYTHGSPPRPLAGVGSAAADAPPDTITVPTDGNSSSAACNAAASTSYGNCRVQCALKLTRNVPRTAAVPADTSATVATTVAPPVNPAASMRNSPTSSATSSMCTDHVKPPDGRRSDRTTSTAPNAGSPASMASRTSNAVASW